jgi:RNA polymerase sigma-70 factor (ECF subfamily)
MEQDSTILISELQQHQPAACQRLFTVYGPMVFRMVQRIVTCREDAEEVYQDVFVKALRGIDGYDPRQATLTTWLSHIAYHESLNFVRGKKLTILYIDDSDQGSDILEAPDDAPQDEETIRKLEQALAKLPPHEQTIVSMFYYDNMSLADMAYVTGSNPSTIGSQLSRIRKKLYRIIKTMQ